ncbi:signal transduction histidine kinase [Haloactinopolyspora alba]|uniref:histidine kinase n=2 Tax=Haloactinopolyspora alba TaxID=648780 RepID=A0A2P8D9E0_9ACTN|nr:signal transduction histidine kinase [Haloactinopolyspora alba]
MPDIPPGLLDAVVTGTLLVTGVIMVFTYTDPGGIDYRDGDALGVAVVVAATAPLLLRRRYPVAVGLVTALMLLTFTVRDYAMPTAVAVILIAIYSAAGYARLTRSLMVLAAHTASSVAYALAASARHPEQSHYDAAALALNVVVLFGAWAFGRAVRNRRLYTAELEDRASRLERAREAEVRMAITEERSRIARELHDVVAHHVSVMTVQTAGARRSIPRDPDRSAEALLSVEATGRAALAEMRRVVGVLRTPDGTEGGERGERGERTDRTEEAALSPQPGLAELGDLVAHMRDAGLPVQVTVDGEADGVPLGVDLAAYRVIQEALTNTIKHAGPSSATVSVHYLPAELRIEIADDGYGVATELEGGRPGHGLLGMRERVALYGGSLLVGPRSGGGFTVLATIPYDSTAV